MLFGIWVHDNWMCRVTSCHNLFDIEHRSQGKIIGETCSVHKFLSLKIGQ